MIKEVFFSECDLNSEIFSSLINDYKNFHQWFKKKSDKGEKAIIIEEEGKIEAFMYLKFEEETINLLGQELPVTDRIKIGTFKTSENLKGKRYGEGLIGTALRKWADSTSREIYVTTFPKQTELIGMLEAYGFESIGELRDSPGELIFSRSKDSVNFSTAKKSFPFIQSGKKGKYLVIDEEYHDTLFPQSKLARGMNETLDLDVKNGITKMYVSSIYNYNSLVPGDFMVVYRKSNRRPAKYNAVATGVVVVEDVKKIKEYNKVKIDYGEFINYLGNKTVLAEADLKEYYYSAKNCSIVTITYNQYFGAGKNITLGTLKDNDLWPDDYPTSSNISTEELKLILRLGGLNEKNIIIDKS